MQRGLRLVLLYLLAFAPIAYAGEVRIQLDSDPTGATVEMGGSVIGTTPLSLSFPTAYFQPPKTVWARHLGGPLVFTLRKVGFVDKRVELGQGPNSWVSLNGSNRFEYYLLRTSYTIRLERQKEATAAPAAGLPYVDELRALAKLRDDGIISDAEFGAKKAVLLGLGTPVPEVPPAPQPSSSEVLAAPQPSDSDEPMSAVLTGKFTSMVGDPWTYSWQLTITNHSQSQLTVDADIQLKAADGTTLATFPQHELVVPAGASVPFTGTFELAAKTSRRVAKLAVVGTRHPAVPTGQL